MSGVGELLLTAAAATVAGYAAGLLHFRSLRAVVARLIKGRRSAFALQAARLALLGVVLWSLALWGAAALIAGTVGVVLARHRVLRREEAG